MKSGGEPTNRERARLIYLRSGCRKSLPQIAEEIGEKVATVKTWKHRDKWDADPAAVPVQKVSKKVKRETGKSETVSPETKRKRGGQRGNKNALENRGGPPPGSQNALATGEYAKLLFSDLSEDERALIASIPEGTVDLMRHDLALLCVRERRMLARIAAIQKDSDNGMIYTEITNHNSINTKSGGQSTTTTTDTTIAPAIERIGHIEEALTRLRREKQRIIDALNECEDRRRKTMQDNPFGADGAAADSNRRMLTFADLLNSPAKDRELSDLEGESHD